MAYEKTVWKNREVERPRTFTKVENADGTITLVPSEGKIIEPGTPIIAANMNNIENGIEEAITKAEQAFQSASDGKQKIATAITGKGVPTSSSDTFQKMADNIKSIETDKTGDATAVAGDILSGKTAYVKGKKLTGTMPNRGAIDNTITTQGGQITIPAGYHNGSGKVKAQFTNLVASNIKKGINIGGVVGGYEGDGPFVKEGIEYVKMFPRYSSFFYVPVRASNKVKLVSVTLEEAGSTESSRTRGISLYNDGVFMAYLEKANYRYSIYDINVRSDNRVRIEFTNNKEMDIVLHVQYTIIC